MGSVRKEFQTHEAIACLLKDVSYQGCGQFLSLLVSVGHIIYLYSLCVNGILHVVAANANVLDLAQALYLIRPTDSTAIVVMQYRWGILTEADVIECETDTINLTQKLNQ